MPIYNPGSNYRINRGVSGSAVHPTLNINRPHKGQDYGAAAGTLIPVAFDGKVIFNGQMNGFGNVIVVEHNIDGKVVQTLYAHMQAKPDLAIGQDVKTGDTIGKVGSTGTSSAAHLHFEIKENPATPGKYDFSAPPQDPLKYNFPTSASSDWSAPEIPDEDFTVLEAEFDNSFSQSPVNNMEFHFFWVRDSNGYEHRASYFGTKQQFDKFYDAFSLDMVRDNSIENIQNWVDLPKDVNDLDYDGLSNDVDGDIDGDGIANADDSQPMGFDLDGDGIPDLIDDDVDGDEISNLEDYEPNGSDYDLDGIPDVMDMDDDGDSIPDSIDDQNDAIDFDQDGTPDYKDADSDGDGIPNSIDNDPLKFDSNAPDPQPPELPPPPPRDPLTLDLNGDGIVNTLPMSRGIHFDLDNSGFAEQTSWVAPEDGLLVLDRNDNNFIDGGAELFGTETLLSNGQYAKHGFEALAEFDTDQDGVVSAGDEIYSSLRVWRDANSNGVADAGELKTLGQMGIVSIGTEYSDLTTRDANNVEHREAGVFTYNNSTRGITNTLWFESDRRITKPITELQGNITIPDAIKQLPNAVGFGNTYSLHHAMAIDASGELQKKVQRFSVELDPKKRRTLSREILVLWTGTGNVVAGSRGNNVDATSLEIMESFWGQSALQDTPFGEYADSISKAYSNLEQSVYSQLMASSHMRDLVSLTYFSNNNGNWSGDFTVVADLFRTDLLQGNEFAGIQLAEYLQTIKGLVPYSNTLLHPLFASIYPVLNLVAADQREIILDFMRSNSNVTASASSDFMLGDSEDNRIYGLGGNDVLAGGKGNDTLYGRESGNTYLFNVGDGKDDIYGWLGSQNHPDDKLVLGAGLTLDNIEFFRREDSLIISLGNREDQITIHSYFEIDNPGFDFVVGEEKFDLNSLLGGYVVKVHADADVDSNLHGTRQDNLITGLGGNDELYGYEGEDILLGGPGNDALLGGEGNDHLKGGDYFDFLSGESGNDMLEGEAGGDYMSGGDGNDVLVGGMGDDSLVDEAGDDEYRYDLGDGFDTINDLGGMDKIVFLSGITPEMVKVNRDDGLRFDIGDTGSINVYSDYVPRIESVVFSNGITWDLSAIIAKSTVPTLGDDRLHGSTYSEVLHGDDGNDFLFAYGGDDTLIGGRGNDLLEGGAGNETYKFSLGDGQDTIKDDGMQSGPNMDGVDTIEFTSEVLPTDITFKRTEFNLMIKTKSNDLIEIVDFFQGFDLATDPVRNSSQYAIENIHFLSTGERWNTETILSKLSLVGTSSNDVIFGTHRNEILEGNGGNDTLSAGGGNDTLRGGAGADNLNGESGDDVLVGGDGSDDLHDYWGNNIFHGGKGTDRIFFYYRSDTDWGKGKNTVRFELGDGVDSIMDSARNTVRIELGAGITSDMLFIDPTSISIKGTSDKLNGIEDNNFYEIALQSGEVIQGEDLSLKIEQSRAHLSADRRIIFGKTEPNLRLTVSYRNLDNSITTFSELSTGSTGDYRLDLGFPVKDSSRITVVGVDQLERKVQLRLVEAPVSATAPKPPAAYIDPLGFVIYGVADPGSTIVASTTDRVIGHAIADAITGDYMMISHRSIRNEQISVVAQRVSGVDLYVSTPATISALKLEEVYDSISPVSPTGLVDGSGLFITGKAEPGALVYAEDYVFGANSQDMLGFSMVDMAGNFRINLREAQIDGSEILLKSFDKTGNGSGTVIYSVDSTRPLPPLAIFDSSGRAISGNAEWTTAGGNQVIVMNESNAVVLGSVTLDSYSTAFKVTLPSALINGEIINVYVKDIAGNTSYATSVVAPDTTKPLLNTAIFDSTGQFISGVAEVGSIINVINKNDSKQIGTTVVDAAGTYSVAFINPLINKEAVIVTAIDRAGNIATPISLTAPDKIRPDMPIAKLDATRKIISGSTEPGITVKVLNASDVVLKTATTNAVTGAYSATFTTAILVDQAIKVVAIDKAGNVSLPNIISGSATPVDVAPPEVPSAQFDNAGAVIAGTAEAGSLVEAKNSSSGILLGKATANAAGAYSITLGARLTNKEVVNITAMDAAGNVSNARLLTAPDLLVTNNAITVQAENYTSMSGVQTENTNDVGGGKNVGYIDPGDWMAYDNVAFEVPVEGRYKVTYRVSSLNGGARFTLKESSSDSALGSVDIPKTGAWTKWIDVTQEITLSGGVHNFKLSVETGKFNINWFRFEKLVTTPDTTPSALPSAAIDHEGKVIAGDAEPGSTVVIKSADNTSTLGTVVAHTTTGAYSITLGTALINSETINISATDAAGNTSAIKAIIAPDKTAPAAPTAILDVDSKIVSGVAEIGSSVVVKDSVGQTLGVVQANATTGAYSVSLTQKLVNGQSLFTTATDMAGNISAVTTTSIVIDTDPLPTENGLRGRYYGYHQPANGNVNLTNVAQVKTLISTKSPDALFIAKDFQYGVVGANELGMGTTLQTFLKSDAATLNIDPSNTSDAILKFDGKIQLDGGSYKFRVRADDGYSILVNGAVVAEYGANQAATTRTHSSFNITQSGLQDIEIVYWDAGGGAFLSVELADTATGNYAYLNESILFQPSIDSSVAMIAETNKPKIDYEGANYFSNNDALIQAMASFVSESDVDTRYRATYMEQGSVMIAVGS